MGAKDPVTQAFKNIRKPASPPTAALTNKEGKITAIHRAVEIEWTGTNGTEFTLQQSNDLQNWKTAKTLSGAGALTSVFLRVSGRTQFWRLQPE